MSQLTFNLVVGTLLRAGIMALAGWLVARGALPSGSVEEWVGAVVLTVSTLLWSLIEKVIQKRTAQVKLNTALDAPAGSSEADIDAIIKAGNGASDQKGVV